MECLHNLVRQFAGKPGSGKFRTWKEDLTETFIVFDSDSLKNQITALPFLLEDDTINYYHTLTEQLQDDWYELMRVLGRRVNCISHEPLYFS